MTTGKLAGRTALVTGAGNGIGRAICQAFAQEGAAVLCADIALDDARVVARGIGEAGGRAQAVLCDVADEAQAAGAVDAAEDAFGGLHVLVSCGAPFMAPAPLEEMSRDDWDRIMAVHLGGAFLLCRAAIPRLRAAGGGSIILVASQMGRVGNAGQAAYCTAKGGLVQLAKVLALECAGDAIRVNALSPGGVATERLARRFGDLETAEREWGPKHPLGRLGQPHELAAGAVFLAGPDSSFMTGADLLIDGGYTAW